MSSFSTRLLFAAYFLEAGLVLLVVPWYGSFWERNFFGEMLPMVDRLISSPFARGAVSGVGLMTMIAGVVELGSAFASKRAEPAASTHQTLGSEP